MKVFFLEWNNVDPEFTNVPLALQKSGHEILYWTHNDNVPPSSELKKQFPQTIFHDRRDALFGIPPEELKDEEFLPPGEDTIKKLFETESILETMKHFERFSFSPIKKKHLYHTYIQYWYGVLEKFKPDVVIFNLWPHSSYNIVIYGLAKLLKIKTLMFEYIRIDGKLMLIDDYATGSQALKEEVARNNDKIFKISDLKPITQKYYEKHLQKRSDVQPPDIKFLYREYAGWGIIKVKLKIALRGLFDLSIFKKFFNYLSKKFGSNLHKEYTKLQVKPDFSKKFLYFALHFQPECSTSPLGGVFVDQVLAIQILSASIPDDWIIYVKEHPYQWLKNGISYTNFRYEGYYRELAKLKNIKFVAAESDGTALIERAEAVATISGTTGWEGLMRLKPAIVFGFPWYRDCPGVFRIHSVASGKDALQKIESGSRPTRQEITNFLYSVDQIACQGYIEYLYREQTQITPEENTTNLSTALINELEKYAGQNN